MGTENDPSYVFPPGPPQGPRQLHPVVGPRPDTASVMTCGAVRVTARTSISGLTERIKIRSPADKVRRTPGPRSNE